jgi:ribose transport system substrate-binding protein
MSTKPRRFRRAPRAAAALIAVAGLALAGATGCGSDDTSDNGSAAADPNKPVKIAFFLLASANTWSQAQVEGAEEAASKLGDVTIKTFDGGFDPTKQLGQIQDATASGQYDAFLISANSGAAVAPAAEQAAKQGIKVVATYEALGPDVNTTKPQIEDITATVILPPSYQGAENGPPVIEACEGKDPCEIAYIGNGIGTPSETAKFDAFKEAISGHKNIKIVATFPNAGFLKDKALTAARDILQAHPNLSGFATSADQTALGVEQAVKDAGKEGKIFITGMGCSTDGVKAVKEDRWISSPCQLPATIGATATDIAVKAVRGEKLTPAEREVNLTELPEWPKGPTKEDLVNFEAQWTG